MHSNFLTLDHGKSLTQPFTRPAYPHTLPPDQTTPSRSQPQQYTDSQSARPLLFDNGLCHHKPNCDCRPYGCLFRKSINSDSAL